MSSTQPLLKQANHFEVTLEDVRRRSERRAWWVAGSSLCMSLVLAAGYFWVMPLKQQVPYLVLADPYRGTSTVAQIDTLNPSYTANTFLAKSNVANFLIARESYDWDLSSGRDKRSVYAMATGPVLAEYKHLHAAGNPDGPDTVYGRDLAIRIKILSLVLQQEPEQAPTGATVRFERWVFQRNSGESRLLDTRVATMKVAYDPHLQMQEEGRYLNPLGFRVTAYRTDADANSVPPAAMPAASGAVHE